MKQITKMKEKIKCEMCGKKVLYKNFLESQGICTNCYKKVSYSFKSDNMPSIKKLTIKDQRKLSESK